MLGLLLKPDKESIVLTKHMFFVFNRFFQF
jgi:hypothetical protein